MEVSMRVGQSGRVFLPFVFEAFPSEFVQRLGELASQASTKEEYRGVGNAFYALNFEVSAFYWYQGASESARGGDAQVLVGRLDNLFFVLEAAVESWYHFVDLVVNVDPSLLADVSVHLSTLEGVCVAVLRSVVHLCSTFHLELPSHVRGHLATHPLNT
jgi:hypothetical protein